MQPDLLFLFMQKPTPCSWAENSAMDYSSPTSPPKMDKKLRDLIHTFLFFGFLFNFGALLAPLAEVRQGQGTSYYPFAFSDFGILIVTTGFISGVVASLGLLRLTILFLLIELGLCGCLHFFSKKLVGDASTFLSISPVGPGIILLCQGMFFWAAFKKWKFESEPDETRS